MGKYWVVAGMGVGAGAPQNHKKWLAAALFLNHQNILFTSLERRALEQHLMSELENDKSYDYDSEMSQSTTLQKYTNMPFPVTSRGNWDSK